MRKALNLDLLSIRPYNCDLGIDSGICLVWPDNLYLNFGIKFLLAFDFLILFLDIFLDDICPEVPKFIVLSV